MIDFEVEYLPDSVAVVKVRGTLNESTRNYFFNCITDLIGTSKDSENEVNTVIIECHGLGYIGSSGMAALLASRNKARKRGTAIYLTHLNSTIASAIKHTKLSSMLAVFPTTEDLLSRLHVQTVLC